MYAYLSMPSNESDYPCPYITPEWQAPEGVCALMSTRCGGLSHGPYATLNLGASIGDAPQNVQENQRRLRGWFSGGDSTPWPAFLHQVHGTEVINLDDVCVRSQIMGGATITGDSSFCTRPGIACVVKVADCMPVLLAVPGGVAAVHAGWRGLAGGIIGCALQRLLNATQKSPEEVVAWLGPCIGSRAFEVGEDVRSVFIQKHEDNEVAFQMGNVSGKWWANLPWLGKLELERHGVRRVWIDGRCTVEQEDLFYSYRRDQKTWGGTGRMAACIWLSDEIRR